MNGEPAGSLEDIVWYIERHRESLPRTGIVQAIHVHGGHANAMHTKVSNLRGFLFQQQPRPSQ